MIKFIARVKCDNPGCSETAELSVRSTVERSSGWDCGCEPGEPEIDDAQGWADFGDGHIRCPACWENQFRFEEVKP